MGIVLHSGLQAPNRIAIEFILKRLHCAVFGKEVYGVFLKDLKQHFARLVQLHRLKQDLKMGPRSRDVGMTALN